MVFPANQASNECICSRLSTQQKEVDKARGSKFLCTDWYVLLLQGYHIYLIVGQQQYCLRKWGGHCAPKICKFNEVMSLTKNLLNSGIKFWYCPGFLI